MIILFVIIHIMVCLFLVGVVLIQSGKGAEMGASFGTASSHTIFGSRGPGSFLSKLTTGAAILFMLTSFSLAFIGKKGGSGSTSVIPIQTEIPSGVSTPETGEPAPKTTETEKPVSEKPAAEQAAPQEKPASK